MTDTAPAERPMPANVIQALARVIEEMPPVSKDAQYSGGGSGTYSYRSIEAVTAAAQHLIGKYGLVPVPKVLSRKTIEVTVGGKPWTQDELEVVYRFYGPGGVEDFIDVGPVWGLGRDNSDKGTNKASTQAYKVALIQLLCVGDSRHDADSERAENDTARPDPEQWYKSVGWKDEAEHDLRRAEARGDAAALPTESRSKIKEWMKSASLTFEAAWTRAEVDELITRTKALASESAPAAHQDDEKAPSAPEPSNTPDAPSLPLPEPEKPTDRKAAIVAQVNAMTPAVLTEYLELRALDIEGSPKDRKARLAKALIAEGWEPF